MLSIKSLKNLLVLSILVFILFNSLAVGANPSNDIDELMMERDALQRQIQEQERKIKEAQQRERTVTNELEIVERELSLTEAELQEVELRLQDNQRRIAIVKEELAEAIERVEQQKEVFKTRAISLYKHGPMDYLSVLLESSSFSELITRMDILKRIIQFDTNLLENLRADQMIVEDRKEELEIRQREIIVARQEIRDKKERIEVSIASRERLLSQIESDKRAHERALDQMESAQKELNQKIVRMQAQNDRGYIGSAKFTWPTPGYTRITSPYGWRTHPVFRTRRFHTGIDIGAPMGARIVAATHGTVIHADWLGGYGLTVVIDHGGGIATMYAHASRILVNVGDNVREGQNVALIGTTGVSTGPHLHFEVKVNGNHANPWNWLR